MSFCLPGRVKLRLVVIPSAQVLLMFCCALVFSRIPVLHRILAPIVTIIIISIPEPLVLLIFALLGLAWNSLDDYMAMASNPNALFFVRFPYFIFVTFFCFLAVLLWDKIFKKASPSAFPMHITHALSPWVPTPLSSPSFSPTVPSWSSAIPTKTRHQLIDDGFYRSLRWHYSAWNNCLYRCVAANSKEIIGIYKHPFPALAAKKNSTYTENEEIGNDHLRHYISP